jgi:hypothetical protein
MTFDPSEKELNELNTGRLMRAEADLLVPMLNRQREAVVAKLCAYYRSGEMAQLPVCAAEIVAIENMKSEIKNKIAKAQSIERKIQNGSTSDDE